jgi:hypothetical protein
MSARKTSEQARTLAAQVTPERIAALINELEPQQHIANRGSVSVDQLVDRLLADAGYPPEQRAGFEVSLKRAILSAAQQIPGMEFVSGG